MLVLWIKSNQLRGFKDVEDAGVRTWCENEAKGPRNATCRESIIGALDWKNAIVNRVSLILRIHTEVIREAIVLKTS